MREDTTALSRWRSRGQPCEFDAPRIGTPSITKGLIPLQIDLTRGELPAPGQQPAVWADVTEGTTTDKRGRSDNTLTLVAELAATKSDGSRFTVSKTYTLNRRGVNALRADLQRWRGGNNPSPEELRRFNPEVEFIGKATLVNIVHATEKGKTVAKVGDYAPDPQNLTKVSDTYIRAKDRAAKIEIPTEAPAQPVSQSATK